MGITNYPIRASRAGPPGPNVWTGEGMVGRGDWEISDIGRDEVRCVRSRSLSAHGFTNCVLPPL